MDLLRIMVMSGVGKSINISNNEYLELYFKIMLEHHHIEAEVSSFIYNLLYALENLGIDKSILNQVYYIDISNSDVEYLNSNCASMMQSTQIRYTIKNLFLLNKDKDYIKEASIIDKLENFKFEVYGKLGHYLKHLRNMDKNALQIKYD